MLVRGFVGCEFQFSLDGSESRFHKCVVVAIAGTAHALIHFCAVKQLAVLLAGILAATIGVVNQIRWRLPAGNGVMQSAHDQWLTHVTFQCPADDATRTQIHQHRQVAPPFYQRDVRNVTDPNPIQFRRVSKVTQQIFVVAKLVSTVGGTWFGDFGWIAKSSISCMILAILSRPQLSPNACSSSVIRRLP